MTESQDEVQTDDQCVLDTLRAENEGLKASLAEAAAAIDNRNENQELLREAQAENQQLRSRLIASAADAAVKQAAEQLGIPPAIASLHAHKFNCDLDSSGQATITPDPVEFFESELKRDPTLRSAVDSLAASARAAAAAAGAVDVEECDPMELLTSLDRNPVRKTRFIARHGVKAYLDLCDRARRC